MPRGLAATSRADLEAPPMPGRNCAPNWRPPSCARRSVSSRPYAMLIIWGPGSLCCAPIAARSSRQHRRPAKRRTISWPLSIQARSGRRERPSRPCVRADGHRRASAGARRPADHARPATGDAGQRADAAAPPAAPGGSRPVRYERPQPARDVLMRFAAPSPFRRTATPRRNPCGAGHRSRLHRTLLCTGGGATQTKE